MTPKALSCLALTLGLLLGCRASQGPSYSLPDSYGADQVERVIAAAQDDLHSANNPGLAFARLELAWRTAGLKGDARQSLDRARSEAAEALLEELNRTQAPPAYYTRLIDASLTRNLAVRARIGKARAQLHRGNRMRAYRTIKGMDSEYPFHAERQASGRLLFDTGMSLALDEGHYGLFFRYKSLAPEVLEYFTSNYYSGDWEKQVGLAESTPSSIWPDMDPKQCGPEAYSKLGELYADSREFALAIQRHEDLIIYYGNSPLVRASRAAIPDLRLRSVQQADHDRKPLELAREELTAWLKDYQGRDEATELLVQQNLLHALQQLAEHDRIVARFYLTVKNAPGAEYHARRGLELAREGGDAEQIQQLQAMLDKALKNSTPVAQP
ncbi:MAG: hypothetical protein H6830_11680 [Planctomycetes bacterium]|nr:hypothetical protein [Planctomycetota bacterium]MCB9908836.1 hypothetical protein [Planctomycetota bacterium]